MILPENGKMIIIDDDESEGKPLLNTLKKEGFLATLFSNIHEELPKKTLSGIRIVFLDLYLADSYQNQKTISSIIMNTLSKIIDKNSNGPILIIAWTKHPDDVKYVELQLQKSGFQFLMKTLTKSSCKTQSGRFSMRLIQKNLQKIIEENNVFEFFILWENLIHHSTSKIVKEFSQLTPINTVWNGEMLHIIAKLARSILGEHYDREKTQEVLENAMYAMNSALTDTIQQETKLSCKTNKIKVKIPKHDFKRKLLTKSDGALNNQLLLKKTHMGMPMPGNIYKNFTKTKVSLKRMYNGNLDKVSKSPEYCLLKHILLEVTPVCDFAEKKSIVNRVLPGIIWPHKFHKDIKSASHYIYKSPVLCDKNQNLFHFVFDFGAFTSVSEIDLKTKKPIYTIQNELLADLQSKLSNHVSRLGTIAINDQ